ncbi:MAG: hypothetical protein JOZ18_23935, partial [Chloroflexi bacterium]|nr:hypothetical protein [Chloroflexota bacterium]
MNTHSSISRKQRSIGLSAFSVLDGLLLALMLMLSSFPTAFAFSPYLEPTPPLQDVTRAGVSVVRLLVTYTTGTTKTATQLQCTGLGVLVASQPAATGGGWTNWVLTDGSLVTSGSDVRCGPSQTTLKLSSIQINLNSAYNGNAASIPLATPIDVRCPGKTTCSNGPALFSFNTDTQHPQPYIDLPATAAGDVTQETGIALTRSTSSLELPPATNTNDPLAKTTNTQPIQQYAQQMIPQYLTPNRVPVSGGSFQPESGMPLVNSSGQLTGLHLSGSTTPFAGDDIRTFLTTQPELKTFLQKPTPNALHDNWDKGITALYQKHYADALTAFRLAATANPEFQAVQPLEQFATSASTAGNEGTGASSSSSPGIDIKVL